MKLKFSKLKASYITDWKEVCEAIENTSKVAVLTSYIIKSGNLNAVMYRGPLKVILLPSQFKIKLNSSDRKFESIITFDSDDNLTYNTTSKELVIYKKAITFSFTIK